MIRRKRSDRKSRRRKWVTSSIVWHSRRFLTVLSPGGVKGLEKQIEEETQAKKKEEDRREQISAKTRNRLTQLLKGRQRESGLSRSPAQDNLQKLAR